MSVVQLGLWSQFSIAFNLLTFILGVVSNCIVCTVVVHSRRLLTNLSNFLVLQLSVADVIWRIYLLAATVQWIFRGIKGENNLYFCIGSNTVFMLCLGVEFGLLAGIALDRYVNIVHPLKGLTLEKKKIKATALVWTYAIAVSFLTPFYVTLGPERNIELDNTKANNSSASNNFVISRTCGIGQDIVSKTLSMFAFVLLFFIPLLVIMSCYVRMLLVLKQRNKRKISQNTRSTKTKRKVVKMLLIVVFSYVVCWLPLVLFNILTAFNFFLENETKKRQFLLTARGFAGLSSCLNPLIYAFYNPRFRSELLKVCRCCTAGDCGRIRILSRRNAPNSCL